MDAKNNNKEKYSKKNDVPLPPELQWEQMEAGIFQKMAALKQSEEFKDTPTPKSNRSRNTLIVASIILCLLMFQFICTPGMFNKNDDNQVSTLDNHNNNNKADDTNIATDLTEGKLPLVLPNKGDVEVAELNKNSDKDDGSSTSKPPPAAASLNTASTLTTATLAAPNFYAESNIDNENNNNNNNNAKTNSDILSKKPARERGTNNIDTQSQANTNPIQNADNKKSNIPSLLNLPTANTDNNNKPAELGIKFNNSYKISNLYTNKPNQKQQLPAGNTITSATQQESRGLLPLKQNNGKGLVNAPNATANPNAINNITKQPTKLRALEYVPLQAMGTMPIAPQREVAKDIRLPIQAKNVATAKRLILSGGVNFWQFGYGQQKPSRHPYQQAIPSFQAQINYMHPLQNGFSVLTGFQFTQLEHRFELVETIDNYTTTLTDTIISVTSNLLTGEQSYLYGDTTLQLAAQHIIKHYNQTKLYQIPIAVGKTWTFNKLYADLIIGGSVNILSTNNGRTLINEEIQYYRGASNSLLNNQWKINALLAGRLTYQVNTHIGLVSGVQLQKSVMNWSTEQGVRMHPLSVGLELGLSYSFNAH